MEPQQPQPPVVPQLQTQSHKLIWLLILLFLLLNISGIALWKFTQKESKAVVEQKVVVNEMDIWKTYRNEDLGIEFKYPADWELYGNSPKVNPDSSGGIGFYKDYMPGVYRQPGDSTGYCSVNVAIFDEDFDNFMKSTGSGNIISSSTIKIDNLNGHRIVGDENGMVDYVYLPISKNVTMSTGLSCGGDVLKDGTNVFDKILSTFKFIDKNDISTWKTYKDKQYPIEFKYPSDWAVRGVSDDPLTLKRNPNGSGGLDVFKEFHNQRQEASEDLSGFCKIGMSIFMEPYQTMLDSVKNDLMIEGVGPITVSGKQGIKGYGTETGYIPFIYVPYSSTETLSIALYAGGDVLETCSQILDKILSTFKFIPEKYKIVYGGFMGDGKLVEINQDGSEKVLIPSFSEVAVNSYKSFNKLSFPENSNKLFLYSFLDGTDAPPGGIWEYNISNKSFKELPNVSKYYGLHGTKSISPNGKYVATIDDPDDQANQHRIFILDLENDKVSKIIELTGNELVTFCSPKGDCWGNMGDLKWLDNQTLEYAVYDSNKYSDASYLTQHPLIENRIVKF